jgi:HlyD family secretion protein
VIRKSWLPFLALLGVLVIVFVIFLDNRPKPAAGPPIQWPEVPFTSYVAGAGLIEASSGNIAIGSPVQGIVSDVYVKWGDQAKVGDRLFKIDDRALQAQQLSAAAAIEEANARRLQAREQLRLIESVPDQRAVSREEVANRRSAVAIAEAVWLAAKAQARQIVLAIERLTVRAPAAGKVLQINIHPGEFAQTGAQAKALMLFGNDQTLYVRVDIDEFNASRIVPGAAAVAFVRGAPQRPVALKFERIEPYVIAKTALTGSPTERVDSRVLQVIYSVGSGAMPVYIGQQMDVYVQTPADAVTAPTSAQGSAPRPAGSRP